MRKFKLKIKLKPCPFCGFTRPKVAVQAVFLRSNPDYLGWCVMCGARGGTRETREGAIKAWNERAENDSN